MRMLVSGVLSSWETLLTKSVRCRTSSHSRRNSRLMSQPPRTMARSKTAMIILKIAFNVFAE